MKALLAVSLAFCAAFSVQAMDTIYRGTNQAPESAVCYYQSGKFYADAGRKECLYAHPGHCVCKGPGPASPAKNALYRFNGGKMYKGASVNAKDAVATIVEYRRKGGATLEAKIYEGFVIALNEQYELSKSAGDKTETANYKITRDGKTEEKIPVLFTVDGNKIYKGDSKDDSQCVLSYTGEFNASRLLFMAMILGQQGKAGE